MTTASTYTPEIGHQVRVQRWEVPAPEIPGLAERKLLLEAEGTVETVRELAGGYLITLEGAGDAMFTGYQFTGQGQDHGASWSLQTEVVPLADVAAHDQAALDAGVVLAEREKAAALAQWERARDAEATARQRLTGAQERLEAAMARAARHRADLDARKPALPEPAEPGGMDQLTERRKADRAVMARYVAQLAEAYGLTAWEGSDVRERSVSVKGPHGLGLTVRFRGNSPQCEPDTYVLSWHMMPGEDQGYRLSPDVFESVNPHHGCKATDTDQGYRELCELLRNRFAHILGGTAFVRDDTAS